VLPVATHGHDPSVSLNGEKLVCFLAPPTRGPSSVDPGHGLRSGTLSPRHQRR
jgi:hypothetical protein